MFAGHFEITSADIPTSWLVYTLMFFVVWGAFAIWTSRLGGRQGHPQIGFLLGFLGYPLTMFALLVMYESA